MRMYVLLIDCPKTNPDPEEKRLPIVSSEVFSPRGCR